MSTIKVNIKRTDRNINYSINLSKCIYPFQIREAFKTSLELAGYAIEDISEVFNQKEDCKACPEEIDNLKQ